jgi:hypothetical protein
MGALVEVHICGERFGAKECPRCTRIYSVSWYQVSFTNRANVAVEIAEPKFGRMPKADRYGDFRGKKRYV